MVQAVVEEGADAGALVALGVKVDVTRARSGGGLSRSRMVRWLWGNTELVAATVILIILLYGKGSQSYPCVLRLIPMKREASRGQTLGGREVQRWAEVPAVAMGTGKHFPCSFSVLDACFTGCSSSELFEDR